MNPPDDVMALLGQARPASLDPAPSPERRERDLSRILAASSLSPAPRRKIPALRLGLGLGFVAAAAAAVLVIASPAPRHTPGPTATSAGNVLLTAADQVAKAPANAGRYWAAKSTIEVLNQVGTPGALYRIRSHERVEDWTARSASEDSWWLSQDVGTSPATDADRAAWVQAGSPTSWKIPKVAGKPVLTVTEASRPPIGGKSNSGSAVYSLGGHNVSVKQLQRLPGDTAKLKAVLLGYFHDGGSGGELPTTQSAWLFQVAASLLSMPIATDTRAATYRMMAALPGVRALGTVTDVDGRTGNGVAIEGTDPFGSVEARVIIDPATGLPLAEEHVYLKATGGRSWLTPDDVWYAVVYQSLGWTDDAPPVIDEK